MDIKDIQHIGKRLQQEITEHLGELRSGAPLGKGAGGDITHAIDKRAEDIIIEELQKLEMPITLVSEECGLKDFFGGGPRLLVDPIDGSRNALTGVPLFSTSIALVDGDTIGDTVKGYVINLVSGDEFFAEKGKGSFLNGVQVKTQADDTPKVVAYEAQVPRIDIPAIMPLISMFDRARCFGSTALDLAFLAQGTLSVFVVPCPSRSFDFAAGYLLIKEAGGIVTDLNGNSIDSVRIGVNKSTHLLAAGNEALHRKTLCFLNDDPSVSPL
jgi:myo-inositol-1(or 4)-monophosphatase